MKTFEFTAKPHDIRICAASLGEALERLAATGEIKKGECPPWRIIPTKRQIRKTQNLMRGL